MSEVELFKEAMRMSYKFTLYMFIIISLVLGLLSYCIIRYNSDKVISTEITATQADNNNTTQEVNNHGKTDN